MMTYLKHVGGKKHSDLKTKSFDEIQVLYEKIKRSDDSFIAIGFAEDEKVIKEINKQVADASKKRVKKDDSVKGEIKAEKGTKKRKSGHVKMIARKRPRPQPDDDSDNEHKKCLRMVSSPDGNYLVVYKVNGYFKAFNYLMEKKIDHVISGTSTEWEFVQMETASSLSKELLKQMIDLGLEVEEDSTAALQLVTFIKQQLNEGVLFEVLNSLAFIVKSLATDHDKTVAWIDCQKQTALELAFLRANGYCKGLSNPLMAGSLPKTTKPT
ncbi:hypothetical protein Tco_0650652 [Tanacetum coccineum]